MADAMSAGRLTERIRFERRGLDANGDALGEFAELFSMAACIVNLRGGEAVMAQRLENKQTVVITVRNCAQVRGLTTADRAVDARTGQPYDIADINPRGLVAAEQRAWRDILGVSLAGGTPGG